MKLKIRRCPLSKRIPRDLIKNCGKYLGIALILICIIAVGSSFQATLNGAEKYLDKIKNENMQEDGFFETEERLDAAYAQYCESMGIKVGENFYATENSYGGDAKIQIFGERKELDIPTLFSGKLPQGADEIALDHVFAKGKKIGIGDTVTLLGKDFKVSGTVSLPDYSSLFMNNTDLMMNTSHFCVAVTSEAGFARFAEYSLTYRYSYRFEDRDLTEKQKIDIAKEMQQHLIQSGVRLRTFLRADQNQSITFLEMDMGKDGPFMKVFVYLLIALIAFVFAILTNNTIDREAVIIGTLLASGYRKREIVWHYLQPTLIVAVVGSAIGNALGYTVMIEPFLTMYYTSYSIGPIRVEFSVPTFLMTTVLPVVIMVLINVFMLVKKLSLSPLKFLRRDLKKKKQKKAPRLPEFSFLNRFRLRVILQNKGSYIMLFIGVFLASFLLMFGIGLKPLMNHYSDTVGESLPFEYQYLLKAPVEETGGEKMTVYEMTAWFSLGKKDISVTLMGIGEDSAYFADALAGGLADDEIAISSALSKKLSLKKGDTLKLKDISQDKEYAFRIGNVYPYDATMVVFMGRDELNALLGSGEGAYNCLISDKKLDIDERCLAKMISRADMLGAAEQMMDSFGMVIFFINVFSVVVYMVLMYILTKVVIDKNALSVSFLKVFGYEHKEIRKLYLTATAFVVILSLLICIPLEIGMFKVILVYLSSMIDGYLEFYLPMWVYAEIIVIGIVAYFAINALHVRGIGKIPMTDALKSRE